MTSWTSASLLVVAVLATAPERPPRSTAAHRVDTDGPQLRLAAAPESRLRVDGTSTLRDFSCDSGALEAAVLLAPPHAELDVASLVGAVESAEVEIAAGALDCGNGTMNEHMRRALKVEANPLVRFTLERHEATPLTGDTVAVEMSGRLALAGVERTIPVSATASRETGGALRLTGSVELDMTDFDVEPPRLFFGTLRVGDTVGVVFDVLLAPESRADPAPADP